MRPAEAELFHSRQLCFQAIKRQREKRPASPPVGGEGGRQRQAQPRPPPTPLRPLRLMQASPGRKGLVEQVGELSARPQAARGAPGTGFTSLPQFHHLFKMSVFSH